MEDSPGLESHKSLAGFPELVSTRLDTLWSRFNYFII